jgi:hypothetical protein
MNQCFARKGYFCASQEDWGKKGKLFFVRQNFALYTSAGLKNVLLQIRFTHSFNRVISWLEN